MLLLTEAMAPARQFCVESDKLFGEAGTNASILPATGFSISEPAVIG